jgi:hypothetical protein
MVNDPELPFNDIVKKNIESSELDDPNLETTSSMLIRIAWPKDLVIARRIDALCELILRPKPLKRPTARSRKRKPAEPTSSEPSEAAPVSQPPPPSRIERKPLSDVDTDSEDDDDETEDEDENVKKKARIPTKPLKSQGARPLVVNHTKTYENTDTNLTGYRQEEMEEGEIASYSDDDMMGTYTF